MYGIIITGLTIFLDKINTSKRKIRLISAIFLIGFMLLVRIYTISSKVMYNGNTFFMLSVFYIEKVILGQICVFL